MSGRAKFVHWIISPYADIQSEPMFNVIENDKGINNGSTVGGDSLLTVYGIPVPLFPDMRTWIQETEKKRRCFRCWATTRGAADNLHHREVAHGEAFSARRFIAALTIALALLVPNANAWEFRRNPDRFPSLGFNLSNSHLDGDRAEISQPSPVLTLPGGGKEKVDSDSVGADLRLPVSDGVTLSGFYNVLSFDSDFMRAGNIYRESQRFNGFSYGMSVRIYFNK